MAIADSKPPDDASTIHVKPIIRIECNDCDWRRDYSEDYDHPYDALETYAQVVKARHTHDCHVYWLTE